MKFSLLMCTIGKFHEPDRLMRSLDAQTYKNFELIIVDQNNDDCLLSLIEKYKNLFSIVLLHSKPGLSHSRNVGLSHVTGDIVAFPDDDCWYSPDLLDGVHNCFKLDTGCDALSVGWAGGEDVLGVPGPMLRLTRYNLWGKVPSISMFMKRCVTDAVGQFDETLGAGAGTPWGAGEDTDYVLRSMSLGTKWVHVPALRVFHAPPLREADAKGLFRARAYARGLGRVLRKHQFPLWMVFGGCFLSVVRTCNAFIRGNAGEARWHLEALAGRIGGWLMRPEPDWNRKVIERRDFWK